MNPTELSLKIAIATEHTYAPPKAPWPDDAWLKEELEKRGHKIEMVDWQDPKVDLHSFDAIYVSTTWNIPSDPNGFFKWMESAESDGTKRLINDSDVLRDNIIKSRYLSSLLTEFGDQETLGGSLLPSKFFGQKGSVADHIEPLQGRSLELILVELDRQPGWKGNDIVLKPIISADSIDTFVYKRTKDTLQASPEHVLNRDEAEKRFQALVASDATRGVIVQPYHKGIEKGEYSLVFFNSTYSHAVQKPRGFRADISVDRKVIAVDKLRPEMVAFGKKLIEHIESLHGPGSVTRTRVDLLEGSKGPVLLELECGEPNTNLLRFDPEARAAIVRHYADAVEDHARRLSRLPAFPEPKAAQHASPPSLTAS